MSCPDFNIANFPKRYKFVDLNLQKRKVWVAQKTCRTANFRKFRANRSHPFGMMYTVIPIFPEDQLCRPADMIKRFLALTTKLLYQLLYVACYICMHVTERSRSDKRYSAENSQHNPELTELGQIIAAAAFSPNYNRFRSALNRFLDGLILL